jgi:hypothetical protein
MWVLALAVVGMHHLGSNEVASHPMSSTSVTVDVPCCEHASEEVPGERHDPSHDRQHDMLHLCLAVLCVVLGLGLILLALWRHGIGDLFNSAIGRVVRSRPPPLLFRGAPALLASLCVLRL